MKHESLKHEIDSLKEKAMLRTTKGTGRNVYDEIKVYRAILTSEIFQEYDAAIKKDDQEAAQAVLNQVHPDIRDHFIDCGEYRQEIRKIDGIQL